MPRLSDNVDDMERVVKASSFEQDRSAEEALEYWMSRSPEERLSEVERLRREYAALKGPDDADGLSEGLRRTLLVVERQES